VTDRQVYGLVLAGGKSRRMGRDKALLNNNGQSQLATVVELLADCVDEVFVSTRRDQAGDKERGKYRQIVDQLEDVGPVAGILAALHEHPDVDWLVVACDLPNISRDVIVHLLQYRGGQEFFTAYTSSYDGLPEPLCALYRSGCADIVQHFVDDGINCPRKILMRSDTMLIAQPYAGALDNINTPDDLQNSVLQAS